MPIGLKLRDDVAAACHKHLGAGPSVAQTKQAAAQYAEAVKSSTFTDAEIERVGEPKDLLEGNLAPTREQGRAAMHAALDCIMDELEQDASFVGCQIDEHRFAQKGNKIACVNFVPIDLVAGTPARRINNPVTD